MEPFYLIVLGIATVFFILVLTGVGLMMSRRDQTVVFPPNANTCPDGWSIATDGQCNIPTNDDNNKNIGRLTADTPTSVAGSAPIWSTIVAGSIIDSLYKVNVKGKQGILGSGYKDNTLPARFVFDPADAKWTSGGKTQLCAQKSWASSNNIAWDGVSNYNSC